MTIGERIKAKRLEKGLTLDQLGQAAGIGKTTILRYETGVITNIPSDRIEKIAQALNTTPAVLMGWETTETPKVNFPEATPIQITGFIPVYGEIPAGVPAFEEERIIDYISTTYAHPENYFALRVKGTSMINAGIPDGAYVTIHKQNTAEDGNIVACRLNGEEATLKRFRRQGDTVMLMPENPEFTPILVSAAEFSEGRAQILGVAKQVTVKI